MRTDCILKLCKLILDVVQSLVHYVSQSDNIVNNAVVSKFEVNDLVQNNLIFLLFYLDIFAAIIQLRTIA